MEEYLVTLEILDSTRRRHRLFKRKWELKARPVKGDVMQAGGFLFEVLRVLFREEADLPEIKLMDSRLGRENLPEAIRALESSNLWEEYS